MDNFKQHALKLFTSMGALKQYNLAGQIVGESVFDYPLVLGYEHAEKSTAVYRAKQVGHLLDTAMMLLMDWTEAIKTKTGPRIGNLTTSMAPVGDSEIIQTSESTIRFLTAESKQSSSCILVVPMYPKLAPLSTTAMGPVAYFLSGDKYCVCLSVTVDSAWKGVKYLLEEPDVCKIFIDVAKDLPRILQLSSALHPRNIYCLRSQHCQLMKVLGLPKQPEKFPQFHRLYGVQNIRIIASSDIKMNNNHVLKYCYHVKSVMSLWQRLFHEFPEALEIFSEGYAWKIGSAIHVLLQGHSSIVPVEAAKTAAMYAQEGENHLIAFLASTHVILCFPNGLRDHETRIRAFYDAIFDLLAVITTKKPLSTETGSIHQQFINGSANMLMLKRAPSEDCEVGSLGDIVRRFRIAVPNYLESCGLQIA